MRGSAIDRGGSFVTVVTTLDITGMGPDEYRAVLDYMGVERNTASGIYLH